MVQPRDSFDWNQARAFLATAETGSFSAAARLLNLTQPTLGRQVAGLESDLGVTLFDRAGRSLVLTQAGQDLLAHVRTMQEAATRVSLAATSSRTEIEGHVTITAIELLAATILPRVIARLSEEAPGLTIEVQTSDAIRDISRREADIAIRHARPTQPDLTARRVGDKQARLYASRAYLDRAGRPRSPADLAGHRIVSYSDVDGMIEAMRAHDLPVHRDQVRHTTNNGHTLWEMVRAGLGLSMMADDFVPPTPDVEAVLPDHPPIVFPVWLVTHRELNTAPRFRLVFDRLAEALSAGGRG